MSEHTFLEHCSLLYNMTKPCFVPALLFFLSFSHILALIHWPVVHRGVEYNHMSRGSPALKEARCSGSQAIRHTNEAGTQDLVTLALPEGVYKATKLAAKWGGCGTGYRAAVFTKAPALSHALQPAARHTHHIHSQQHNSCLFCDCIHCGSFKPPSL